MNIIAKIALRNLLRHFRRTLITVCSIAFGLAVILWLQSILHAASENVINSITKAHIGHVQIFKKNYFPDRVIKETFTNPIDSLHSLLPKGAKWAERLSLPSLASSGEQSMPVLLVGVNPQVEKDFTVIGTSIIAGSYLKPETSGDCGDRQAVIGSALAKALNVNLGNKIVVLSNASDGTLGNELLRVQGIYSTGAIDFEKSILFTTLGCVRKIGVLSGVHELDFRLLSSRGDLDLVKLLETHVDPGLFVTTWRKVDPNIDGIVHYNNASFVLVSVMLFIVITLGIVNNVMVSVFERTKEFGVMLALGTAPWQVVVMVVLETIFMGLIASALGIFIGSVVVVYHHRFGFDLGILVGDKFTVGAFKIDSMLYPEIDLHSFVRPLLITMFFVLISAIYPALIAAKLKPIEAMR